MKNWILLVIVIPLLAFVGKSPFDYDLHLYTIPGKGAQLMVCLHGSGANYKIADTVKKHSGLDDTIVSFNFPDHDMYQRSLDPKKLTFGTMNELLPAIYVLKKVVVEKKRDSVNLYGFSAGGGAIVNLIKVLNSSAYDHDLQKIGVSSVDKKAILEAIQNGVIILDSPLKSMEELIDFRGSSPELEMEATIYRKNKFVPIDSIKDMGGLSLTILIHFQVPDEILSNRDDALFIERLKKYNSKGTTWVSTADEGGHSTVHFSLWKLYSEKREVVTPQ